MRLCRIGRNDSVTTGKYILLRVLVITHIYPYAMQHNLEIDGLAMITWMIK